MKTFGDGSAKFLIKQCKIFRRTKRTLLQDLAQKSLKGLGTKAWTNWEDRRANSLAHQVSKRSIFFLYTGCPSLQSSHLVGAIFFHHLDGFRCSSEPMADAPGFWYFLTERAWRCVPQALWYLIAHCQSKTKMFAFILVSQWHGHDFLLEQFLSELWQQWRSTIVATDTAELRLCVYKLTNMRWMRLRVRLPFKWSVSDRKQVESALHLRIRAISHARTVHNKAERWQIRL